MSAPAVTIDADADVHAALPIVRTHAVRRLAVVRDGSFVGMVTVDDLLVELSSELADLARPVFAESAFGHHDSPPPVRAAGQELLHR